MPDNNRDLTPAELIAVLIVVVVIGFLLEIHVSDVHYIRTDAETFTGSLRTIR